MLLHFSCFQISKTDSNPEYLPTRRAAGYVPMVFLNVLGSDCVPPPRSCTILHSHYYYTGPPSFLYFSPSIFLSSFPSSFFFLSSFLSPCLSWQQHANVYELMPPYTWGFPSDQRCWTSLHVSVGCLNIFFREVSFQVLWPIEFIVCFFVVEQVAL